GVAARVECENFMAAVEKIVKTIRTTSLDVGVQVRALLCKSPYVSVLDKIVADLETCDDVTAFFDELRRGSYAAKRARYH
ncbi:MAG: hypothetical protein ACO32I_08190, partial [Candidatus Limnocylindrus sp.]